MTGPATKHIPVSSQHSAHAAEESLQSIYRHVPQTRLSAVVDTLGGPCEEAALRRARDTLLASSPQCSARERLLRGYRRPDLETRLMGLARRQCLLGTAAVSQERESLRADLDLFAASTPAPRELRPWSSEVQAERHRARLALHHAESLRLLRQAAAQMSARGDLGDDEIDNQDDMTLLRLPRLAVNQMVFESMGGDTEGGTSTLIAVSMPALGPRSENSKSPILSHLAVGMRLSEAVAGLAGLDAIGRLRLREATYSRLMCRPLAAALRVPTAPGESAIPDAADRLAREITSLTMQVPSALKRLVQQVFAELAGSPPER